MKASHTFWNTLRDAPAGLELPGAQLLARAGLVRSPAAAVWTFLPLGQLALDEPLRGGATIHSSGPEDARMATAAHLLLDDTPQLAHLAPLVAHVGTPFRRMREFGEHIPLAARIVRVANAWDDITEGARSPRARTIALERLHLGLGYDYDPEVVSALERALEL